VSQSEGPAWEGANGSSPFELIKSRKVFGRFKKDFIIHMSLDAPRDWESHCGSFPPYETQRKEDGGEQKN